MTLNEQIMKLQTYNMYEGEDTVYVERDDVLKLLEQEPCDCISRQAVIDIINFENEWLYDVKSHNADTKIAFSALKSKISEMPSVTPQPKTGRWLEKEVIDDKVIKEWQSARCSVCERYHTTPYKYYFSRYNFCPNCGARMEAE